MTRSVKEWIGKTDNTPAPPRVRIRVFEFYQGVCQITGRKIRPGDKWELDHIIALVNGGENRESNLHPVLAEAHKAKTRADVKEKADIARKKAKHLGLHKPKGRPMAGTKRSGWKRKLDGTVERRVT